jgi:ribosomal protein L12E/L44/L45/RPP1/RPP2
VVGVAAVAGVGAASLAKGKDKKKKDDDEEEEDSQMLGGKRGKTDDEALRMNN